MVWTIFTIPTFLTCALVKSKQLGSNKHDSTRSLRSQLPTEIKERIETLKGIAILSTVSYQDLQRLATLLSRKVFAKNMGIILQGDQTSEIFFIKSGECRVVMELYKGSRPTFRARSQVAPANHQSIKHARGKSEGPNRVRGEMVHVQQLPTRCQSAPLPYSRISNTCLKGELEGNSEFSVSPQMRTSANDWYASPQRRVGADGSSNLSYATCEAKHPNVPCLHTQAVPKLNHNLPAVKEEERYTLKQAKSHVRDKSSATETSYFSFSTQCQPKPSSSSTQCQPKPCVNSQRHEHQLQEKARAGRSNRKKNHSKTCMLMSLLREIGNKDEGDSLLDFDATKRQHETWYVESDGTALLKGNVYGEALSESKVDTWARNAVFTEKKRRAEASNTCLPTGAECAILDPITEDTAFLEIGALYEGEFFGEIDPLPHSKWKASILTVTPVEVFVLQNSDFLKYIDKDRIACLSENEFKSVEHIYQEYQKTRKWALYKRKVMKEVLESRRQRFPHRSGHELGNYVS